jgi:hypothetical protein
LHKSLLYSLRFRKWIRARGFLANGIRQCHIGCMRIPHGQEYLSLSLSYHTVLATGARNYQKPNFFLGAAAAAAVLALARAAAAAAFALVVGPPLLGLRPLQSTPTGRALALYFLSLTLPFWT